MWSQGRNGPRGSLAGRHDLSKEADTRLRGAIHHGTVDPIGTVSPEYLKAVADGVDPYKTVNEFLRTKDYYFGKEAFGRMARRYGNSEYDAILLFMADNPGVDGPIYYLSLIHI